MNWTIFLVIFLFGGKSRAMEYFDISGSDSEEIEQEYFDAEDYNFTSEFEGPYQVKRHLSSDSSERPLLHLGNERKNYEKLIEDESKEDSASSLAELISGNQALDEFLQIYHSLYGNSEENDQIQIAELNQAPIRRQINSWRLPDELFDAANMPWNYDSYYPNAEAPMDHSEYLEESKFLGKAEQKNHSYVGTPETTSEYGYQVDHPQYFQKNYYYNYYPLISDRKYDAPNRDRGKMFNFDETIKKEKSLGRKKMRKNPCRQYLQFLKYAFKELDKNSDYNYDYNDEYNSDWDEREMQKTRPVFGTHLLGPTLYIDNSGKVAQISNKGDSIQMVDGISPSSKLSIITKNAVTKANAVVTTAADEKADDESQTLTYPPYEETPNVTDKIPGAGTKLSARGDFSEDEDDGETPGPPTTTPSTTTYNNSHETKPVYETKYFQEWTQMYRSGFYSTTGKTDVRRNVTNEDEDKRSTLFYPTISPTYRYMPDDDYYENVGNPNDRAVADVLPETANSSARPSVYWFVKSSTPFPPIGSPPLGIDHIKTKTVVSIEESSELRKKDVDCNDKMLPCPDTVNVTYPLNGYCNRYVSCESGRAIRRTCSEGLHFNIITKSCDFPHNSFCTYTCPEPNGYYGIPGDCGGYFICKKSHLEYRMCPPKMHWDIRTNTCTFAQLSSCPMKCSRRNQVSPYEGDCKGYIICLNNIPYYHKCPPNTKFDSGNQMCVPDDKSRCVDDPRLLTKTINFNSLCKDTAMKTSTRIWCSYFFPSND